LFNKNDPKTQLEQLVNADKEVQSIKQLIIFIRNSKINKKGEKNE